ncbi:MAG: tRNA threonylcarbamoyladenosine biosynthesis protein TsaE [Parcubacteria group bacterium ADurb.Bin316]|nr:MAG: tRNA threonylcarbamoyladenosine biosynthesis protein TsaE [Parcubacteria group bacterium ADurb.Bin316]HOZ55632.1 tRNA (adenosine(37)-N6)-threonylcarbamoyltransferase complex ATPase subunit type 1 TsaE [bacterium]
MKIITKNEKATFNFAKKFAESLQGGEIIGLIGDLGAGKTVFTKGLAAGLGVKNIVNSPTFVIMKVYDIKKTTSRIKKLVHIDAYRLQSTADLEVIGAQDYFNRLDTITVIEWIDKIKSDIPKKNLIALNFIHQDNDKRTINYNRNKIN